MIHFWNLYFLSYFNFWRFTNPLRPKCIHLMIRFSYRTSKLFIRKASHVQVNISWLFLIIIRSVDEDIFWDVYVNTQGIFNYIKPERKQKFAWDKWLQWDMQNSNIKFVFPPFSYFLNDVPDFSVPTPMIDRKWVYFC